MEIKVSGRGSEIPGESGEEMRVKGKKKSKRHAWQIRQEPCQMQRRAVTGGKRGSKEMKRAAVRVCVGGAAMASGSGRKGEQLSGR